MDRSFHYRHLHVIVLLAVIVRSGDGQSLKTRQCRSTDALLTSRCKSASNAASAKACSAFCKVADNSSALWNYFCDPKSTPVCLVTPYCLTVPACDAADQTLKKLTTREIGVPCDFEGVSVNNGQPLLEVPAAKCGERYFVNQQTYETGDQRIGYLNITEKGVVTRGSVGPAENVNQTIGLTFSIISNPGRGVYFNTVNLTFQISTCRLRLRGPSGPILYCPADPFPDGNASLSLYPQLRYEILNAPPEVPFLWDYPGDEAGNLLGATVDDLKNAATYIYSPKVISSTNGDNRIFISSYNDQIQGYGLRSVGIYGASEWSKRSQVPGSCQWIRISAMPQYTIYPFIVDTKVIQVCVSPVPNCRSDAVKP